MDLNELDNEQFATFLQLYEQAKEKLDDYLKTSNKKVSKKEYDKLLGKFFDEELENLSNTNKNKSFDGMDDLDFDEMNDVWDEMDQEDANKQNNLNTEVDFDNLDEFEHLED